MATKNRTEIEFVAKGKGFEEQKRKAEQLAESVNPKRLGAGFTHMQKQMGQNLTGMKALNREVMGITKALGQFSQVVDKIDKMADGLKKATKEGKEFQRTMAAKGAFTQGFLQQMPGFAPFLQRGPGMGRQAAGQMAGGAVRSTFAGLQGLTQGIANIPGIGLMAGPLQAALQGAQENLQLMQTETAVRALGGTRARAGALAASAKRGVLTDPKRAARSMELIVAAGAAAKLEATRESALGLLPGSKEDVSREMIRQMQESGTVEQRIAAHRFGLTDPRFRGPKSAVGKRFEAARVGFFGPDRDFAAERKKVTTDAIAAAQEKENLVRGEQRQKAASAASAKAFAKEMMGASFGGIAAAGQPFGLNVKQAREAQLQLLQAGGGAARDTGQILQAALGAEAGFGVGRQTAAQFLRAQRQGGLAGMRPGAPAGELLTESIRNAMWAGNEGQELVDAMNRTAAGIQQFQQTGMPWADTSIAKMSRGFQLASTALSARGGMAAEAITKRTQRIAQTGRPETALDVALLRQAGGLQGGLVGFEQALQKLRAGDVGGFAGFQNILRDVVGGPGMLPGATGEQRASARLQIQEVLRQLNAGLFSGGEEGELEALRRSISGEQIDPESEMGKAQARVRKRLGASGARMKEAASAKTLIAAGQKNVDVRRKRQAGIESDRLGKTRALLTTTQNLAESQNNLLDAVKQLAPLTEGITKSMGDMTALIPQFIEFMKWAIKKAGIESSQPEQ